MTVTGWRRAKLGIAVVNAVIIMAVEVGCSSDFAERSFRAELHDSVRLAPGAVATEVSTREWLNRTHRELAGLLPTSRHAPLLTEDLVCPGRTAADVFCHFGMRRGDLQTLLRNYRGLRHSAQAASRDYHIECSAPPWPGFEDVWIPIRLPIDDELQLSGRLGYARDAAGDIIDADCIVVLPGLFGDHGVKRSADICMPLREAGFHILHLELRGHGQTERRYPHMYHSFGVLETDDLMQVADWLQALPHVRRTGIVSYCWTANIGLLAAWYDGRSADDPSVPAPIARYLMCPAAPTRRRFSAGVVAFSPVVRWEDLMDQLDRDRSRWKHPIYAAIQDTIRDRMRRKGYPLSGSLRKLVQYEYEGYGRPMPKGAVEGYPFLRLVPYNGEPAGDKLERARTPVLIVHGADDPLVPAQDIADLVAPVRNPLVAALILPSGGHVGFAGYAPRYYLSLITNFFDPVTGPAGEGSSLVP